MSSSPFAAKRVLITGASAGIGAATARALAGRGAALYLTARRSDLLRKVGAECTRLGAGRVELGVHDLSVPGQGGLVVQECLARLGGLDILICNAGFGVFGPIQETSPDRMQRLWQVNFQSAYESIFEAVPHFRKAGGGHIVLTSSIVGKKGMAFAPAYCATKFAQVGLGEALWGELSVQGIDVTVVCPGSTASEFHAAADRSPGTPNPMTQRSGQSSEAVAESVVHAIQHRKREIHLTGSGKFLLLLDRISPALSTRLMAWVGRSQLGPRR